MLTNQKQSGNRQLLPLVFTSGVIVGAGVAKTTGWFLSFLTKRTKHEFTLKKKWMIAS